MKVMKHVYILIALSFSGWLFSPMLEDVKDNVRDSYNSIKHYIAHPHLRGRKNTYKPNPNYITREQREAILYH